MDKPNFTWEDWENPYIMGNDTVEWIKSRPKQIQDMIVKFPPDAKVRTKPGVKLHIPAPGESGIVCSWCENGCVSVVTPTSLVRAHCAADDLELIECRPGTSVEEIEKILKEEIIE